MVGTFKTVFAESTTAFDEKLNRAAADGFTELASFKYVEYPQLIKIEGKVTIMQSYVAVLQKPCVENVGVLESKIVSPEGKTP